MCVCVCVLARRIKRTTITTTTWCAFNFVAHLWSHCQFTAQMEAEVASPPCSSYLKIEIYWNLHCDDDFVTTLLVIDRRRRSALVCLTYIARVGLLFGFFLTMGWHKGEVSHEPQTEVALGPTPIFHNQWHHSPRRNDYMQHQLYQRHQTSSTETFQSYPCLVNTLV